MARKTHWIFWATFLFFTIVIQAGNTGKVRGVVTDANTGDPLIGANIVIENTIFGAAADMDGKYIILNIPPGNYAVRATMIGYNSLRVENVNVSVDFTTDLDIELTTTILESGETVTVTAERPMVVRDLTATTAVVGAEEIEALPVTEVGEAIELQAGLVKDAGGGIHVRGGRSGEISYWIDGIPVTDVYDGGTVVDVNKNMVQELQVVSGAFNAEYGQAMSGIVNITTKEGSNAFGGSFSTYFGDYLSRHNHIFTGIDEFSPTAIRNVEGGLHGPIIPGKLFFYVNARDIYFDGWLHGRRNYNPGAVTTSFSMIPEYEIEKQYPDRVLRDYESFANFTGYYDDLFKVQWNDTSYSFIETKNLEEYMLTNGLKREQIDSVKHYSLAYIHGSEALLDSFITMFNTDELDSADFSEAYQQLRNNHKDGKGDQKIIPMNWNRKRYFQGKLIYRLTPAIKLSYNYIMDNVEYEDYDFNYSLNPDGNLNRFRDGQTHIFQITHTLSASTFYNLGISQFTKEYSHHTYDKMNDSLYVHPFLELQLPYSFKTGGTNNSWFHRKTNTLLTKLDITSQITKTHQVKAGAEWRQYKVSQKDITLRPVEIQSSINLIFDSPYIDTRIMDESTIYNSAYQHEPAEISAYIQDKMEFKNMIVNLGVRADYFNPDGIVLNDESDPSIYNPIKPSNLYRDIGSDGIPGTFDPDGTEGNGRMDPGEPGVTLQERQTYWYKKASSKLQISPRLGISFPVTERGIFHFSYGHFFQIPRFERLYQNPDFELEDGTGNVGVIGNADLKPEQTISGEIGLQQQLTEDIAVSLTGYFRDIRDLAGTRAEEIELFGGSARYSKMVNSDFGMIKGLTFAVNKRLSQNWAATLDYTLQTASGSNSDPEAARNALEGGSLPEVQFTPLDWDQKHTVNASFTYASKTWGTSIIAQWGSGLPYTPRRSEDISALLTNSQRKPASFNMDLRAYKDFNIGPGKLTFFCRILNVFDNLNEINVYEDTGRAGFTTDQRVAEATNPTESINTLKAWYTNPTHYSEPRRIEAGLSYTIDSISFAKR
ncbi:carboxypeptidase-like regulatory domain-containing protein [bacterium]|nr:carboxypeptidase-like regulatory domain-containing protein [bacterium]